MPKPLSPLLAGRQYKEGYSRRFFPLGLLLILSALFSGCGESSTEPEPPVMVIPIISLEPDALRLWQNETAELTLRLKDFSSQVFGLSLQIEYDSSVAHCADSLILRSEGYFGADAVSFLRCDSSEIHLAVSRIRDGAAGTDTSAVCGFLLRGQVPGTCPLRITEGSLRFYNADGDAVEIDSLTIKNSTLTVD